jgi:hypothetical protein
MPPPTVRTPEKPCTASVIEHQLKVFEVLGHGTRDVRQNCLSPFKCSILEFLEGWMLSGCLGGQTFAACCSQKSPSKSHASLILLIRWQRRYLKFRNTI